MHPTLDVERPPVTGALASLPTVLTPHRNLLGYYLLASLLLGPFFIIAMIPAWFRYRTLRYEVDAEGITMRWGILFRREVSLTYARIQDIQLTSNVVERWLGLARIQLQTASGNSGAEMTLEGLREFDQIRDFLYERMRGVRGEALLTGGDRRESAARVAAGAPATATALAGAAPHPNCDELIHILNRIADELHALRTERHG